MNRKNKTLLLAVAGLNWWIKRLRIIAEEELTIIGKYEKYSNLYSYKNILRICDHTYSVLDEIWENIGVGSFIKNGDYDIYEKTRFGGSEDVQIMLRQLVRMQEERSLIYSFNDNFISKGITPNNTKMVSLYTALINLQAVNIPDLAD